jgi:hypothetical protein
MKAESQGSHKEFRDYVAYPLKRTKVVSGSLQSAGNCFVYRHINGNTLKDYFEGKTTQRNYSS